MRPGSSFVISLLATLISIIFDATVIRFLFVTDFQRVFAEEQKLPFFVFAVEQHTQLIFPCNVLLKVWTPIVHRDHKPR